MDVQNLDPQQRFREKEEGRAADAEALAAGRITAQQLKRDNESFAFGPDRARVDWEVARTRH